MRSVPTDIMIFGIVIDKEYTVIGGQNSIIFFSFALIFPLLVSRRYDIAMNPYMQLHQLSNKRKSNGAVAGNGKAKGFIVQLKRPCRCRYCVW